MENRPYKLAKMISQVVGAYTARQVALDEYVDLTTSIWNKVRECGVQMEVEAILQEQSEQEMDEAIGRMYASLRNELQA